MSPRQAHETLLDVLHSVTDRWPQTLKGVYERSGVLSREAVVLHFSDIVLVVAANDADDTVAVSIDSTSSLDFSALLPIHSTPPWIAHVGAPLGWAWAATNQNGYTDGVLLSFGDLEPHVMLCVFASQLRTFSVQECVRKHR